MIPKDKLYHIISGTIIATIGFFIGKLVFNLDENNAAKVGLALTIVGGLSKEVYDMKKKNPTGFDKIDLLATVVGGAFTVIALMIIF